MLHPKNNRIDYGDQLVPPSGYELSYAVGTSYSLDLEALMILPVALFYAQKIDGNPDDLRYDMLDAVTNATKKIKVFYQKGQLKVPQKYHHLMAYWESGILPIIMPNHVSSFHPKVWISRYEAKGLPTKYRILVTSRNLTFARDWDIAYATDGDVSKSLCSESNPLIHFLHYLNAQGNNSIPATFIKDLQYVNFEIHNDFEGFRFIPIGIPNPETLTPYVNPLTNGNTNWDEMLIISPFVDKTTLEHLEEITRNTPYLLSRKEELDAIDEDTINKVACWQFATFFQQAEYMQELEDNGLPPRAQHLHAKLFVAMKNNKPFWYLGSANCTNPAQSRNVEFMIELNGGSLKRLTTTHIFKTLTDSTKSDNITLFTPYKIENSCPTEERKIIELDIRKIKYDLSLLDISGTAELIEGGTAYRLIINIDAKPLRLPSGYEVKVRPLPEQQRACVKITEKLLNRIDSFSGYAETALSVFLEFEIVKDDVLWSRFLLPMTIDLPENRLNKIFTAIINSREKFLKYLTFLLSGDETNIIENHSKLADRNNIKLADSRAFMETPIYEKLLIASSRFPHKLDSIDTLIQRLKAETSISEEAIITDEFESFWSIFQTFAKSKRQS